MNNTMEVSLKKGKTDLFATDLSLMDKVSIARIPNPWSMGHITFKVNPLGLSQNFQNFLFAFSC